MIIFGTSSFLYLTPPGLSIREFLAQTVISTQHRDWAWIVVGAEKRDYMVKMSHQFTETSALEKQDFTMIKHDPVRRARSVEELISEPKDISGQFWKGKMIYVYDPTSVRVVVPNKVGEGERISSMVKRTGAVAGINGGGFVDPDGLGNGFAPIGLILSGNEAVYADVEPSTAQHIIGFTKEGTLVVGKYSLFELQAMGVKDAVSFLAPRLIANGNPQITTGDGGWGRAPRTAIGQKEDGTLIFVIIDGRQTSSVGATLKEVQDLLLKEGAVNAGMMDGGASSELVVKGEVLTKPSSRYGERRLPSGLLVFDEPDSYKVDRIWDNLGKIDPGGAYDHPDFLKEQAELKRQQQNQPKKVEPEKTTEPPKTQESAKTQTGSDTSTKTTTTPPKTGNTNTSGEKPAGGTTGGGTPASGSNTADSGGAGAPAGSSKPDTPSGSTTGGTTAPSTGTGTPAPGGNGSTGGTTNGTAPAAGSGTGAPVPGTGSTSPAGSSTTTPGGAPAASGGGSGQPATPSAPAAGGTTGSTAGSGSTTSTTGTSNVTGTGAANSPTSNATGTSASTNTTVSSGSAASAGTTVTSGTATAPTGTTGTTAPAQ
ncbi:hypothetical protein FE783_01715 [Paenibacillus mesophilus]|nr:hypothetical protein FE783_01715 [Paenibacillus mesophilus]